MPSARAKHNAIELELDEVLLKVVSAKGNRLSHRAVHRVSDVTGTPKKNQPAPLDLPGLKPADNHGPPSSDQE